MQTKLLNIKAKHTVNTHFIPGVGPLKMIYLRMNHFLITPNATAIDLKHVH